MIFEVLLKLSRTRRLLFTSFKNDTVNQMRAKMAAVVPNLADKKVYFRTNDSIRYAHGIYIFDEDENVFKRLEPDFIFVEEAGMSAQRTYNRCSKTSTWQQPRRLYSLETATSWCPSCRGARLWQ